MTVQLNDTITAIATPLFPAGIGIIRISGPEAVRIADEVFAGERPTSACAAYTAQHGYVKNPDTGEKIDEAVCLVMRKPYSYTGEDVVEISMHGSPLLLRNALESILNNGARQAEAGEFTYRAYINGKINLTEAEAVHNLVSARSETGLRNAFLQLQGSLRRPLQELRQNIMEVISHFEAEIEFPAEGLSFITKDEGLKQINGIMNQCSAMIETFPLGKRLEEGVKIVICGPPNSGKSTVLNKLLKEEKAIVYETPGTTRDKVEGTIAIKGAVIQLIDTAGIRKTHDSVEKIGIQKTIESIKSSDIILWIKAVDIKAYRLNSEIKKEIEKTAQKKRIVQICNKIDLLNAEERKELRNTIKNKTDILLSAKKGWGIKTLYREIEKAVESLCPHYCEGTIITNLRQEQLLKQCRKSLKNASKGIKNGVSLEYICQDLNESITALNQLIGTEPQKDIYEKIFKHFCVGK